MRDPPRPGGASGAGAVRGGSEGVRGGGCPLPSPLVFLTKFLGFTPKVRPQREAVEGFGSTPLACEPAGRAGGGEQGSALFLKRRTRRCEGEISTSPNWRLAWFLGECAGKEGELQLMKLPTGSVAECIRSQDATPASQPLEQFSSSPDLN